MIQKEIERIVFAHKPALKSLLEKNGSLSLAEYFRKSEPTGLGLPNSRKKELIETIGEKTRKLLGEETAETLTKELATSYFASTADHHQPLVHPFFSNANLVQSFVNNEKGLKNILVLACSNISVNNSSYPRGIFYHDQNLEEIRIPFFSLKYRHYPVFGLEPYQKENLKKIPIELKEVYLNEKVLNAKTYSDQITLTNFELWKKVPGQKEINLIYLNQEEVVSNLILNHHLDETTAISEILVNPAFRESFRKNFENITGAFSTKNRKGTFLFWGLKKGGRIPLSADDPIFTSTKSIRTALQNREIFPSMALSFIVLSFYYHIPCGGGFSQINYLTEMKTAYLKLLTETNSSNKEIMAVEKIPTNIFRGEFVLARLSDHKKSIPASLIDLILYSEAETGEKLYERVRYLTLKSALDEIMPEFYKIITGSKINVEIKNLVEPVIYVP